MSRITWKDTYEQFTYNSNNQILTHITQKDNLITYEYEA